MTQAVRGEKSTLTDPVEKDLHSWKYYNSLKVLNFKECKPEKSKRERVRSLIENSSKNYQPYGNGCYSDISEIRSASASVM